MIAILIPARSGSKGLLNKNVKTIGSKPLFVWTILAAKKCKSANKILLSTDSHDYAKIAEANGCEADIRPLELSSDNASTIDLVNYYSNKFPKVLTWIILQPTSPIRLKGFIDSVLSYHVNGKYDNTVTGFYCMAKEFGTHNNLRRQDYSGFFYDDGSVYILSKELCKKKKWYGDKIGKYESPRICQYEIDDAVDFEIVESLINKYTHEF